MIEQPKVEQPKVEQTQNGYFIQPVVDMTLEELIENKNWMDKMNKSYKPDGLANLMNSGDIFQEALQQLNKELRKRKIKNLNNV